MSVIQYARTDYVGVVQNQDQVTTTFYDYGAIKNAELQERFLSLGEQWWWESNRKIPINLFLRTEWQIFRHCRKTFMSRELVILHGPTVSLFTLAQTSSKRRSITLVQRPSPVSD